MYQENFKSIRNGENNLKSFFFFSFIHIYLGTYPTEYSSQKVLLTWTEEDQLLLRSHFVHMKVKQTANQTDFYTLWSMESSSKEAKNNITWDISHLIRKQK